MPLCDRPAAPHSGMAGRITPTRSHSVGPGRSAVDDVVGTLLGPWSGLAVTGARLKLAYAQCDGAAEMAVVARSTRRWSLIC
jgi:hypothetical protein